MLMSSAFATHVQASPPALPPPPSANVEDPIEDAAEPPVDSASPDAPEDALEDEPRATEPAPDEPDPPRSESTERSGETFEPPPIQRPSNARGRTPVQHEATEDEAALLGEGTEGDEPPLPDEEADAVEQPEAGTRAFEDASSEATEAVPRPLSRPRAAGAESSAAGMTALRKESEKPKPVFEHRGFVMQALLGTMGCTRDLCARRHGATPGLHVGGFIGGNIAGFVELGAAGDWGRLETSLEDGTSGTELFGIDPIALGAPASLGSGMLDVRSARLSSASAGPHLRVHFIPRGRVTAFVGSGARYQLFRGDYDTASGKTRLDFHGLQVPIEGGVTVHVVQHVSLGLGFTYQWTHYLGLVLDTPSDRIAMPLSILQEQMESFGRDLRGELPQFWTVDAAVRLNF
jgi:hypothetical protein